MNRSVGWLGSVGSSLGVDWSAFIGDLSHVPIVVVSSVLDMLDPAIRQRHGVGSSHYIAITRLSSVEVGLGVVISHAVLESIGLLLTLGFMIHWFRMVGSRRRVSNHWSSVDSVVDWGMMRNNRSMVNQGGSVYSMMNWSMVDQRSCMNSMMRKRMSHHRSMMNQRSSKVMTMMNSVSRDIW